jgi:hypothetical protein
MTRGLYIGNVKMSPRSTREAPWMFARLSDAREFALISFRYVWAVVPEKPDTVYRVWPGGRVEEYFPTMLVRRNGPKKAGTSSGTSRERHF